VNTGNGSLKWKYQTGDSVNGTPTVTNGIAYIASGDGKLYALDANSGQVKWKFSIANQSVSGDWTSVVNGRVYLGMSDGRIYALNAGNGQIIWKTQTSAAVTSPAIGL
jgi:outer membrane protein assembly factor BamB